MTDGTVVSRPFRGILMFVMKLHFIQKFGPLLAICLAFGNLQAQTGTVVAELDPIERRLIAVMQKHRLPGASFALARGGKLIYARGFGFADRDRQIPVDPDSLFRTGSIAKPITALTLLKLQEQGKLTLDAKVFDILSEYQTAIRDPRLRQITVRQLLHHTGGWDPETSGDPLFPDHSDIGGAGGSFPPTHQEVIEAWLRQPLDANPGTAYNYSNFGFLLAGRVIAKVFGQPYSEAVRDLVLAPQGITHVRIGRSLEGQVAPNEVRYYDVYSRRSSSIFSVVPQQVALPYGTFSLELADSAGGWIASAPDLVRLLTAANNTRGSLLHPSSFQQFVERPAGLRQESTWYGLGIVVAPASGGVNFIHNGGIPGTHSLFGSFSDGVAFAFLTNTNPGDGVSAAIDNDVAIALTEGMAAIGRWPDRDQFPSFFPAVTGGGPTLRAAASAASFAAGALSPGELLSLFGTGLGPLRAIGARVENNRVTTELEGIRVYFDGTPAPLLYAQDGQVNVVAPFDLALKADAAITVDNKGLWSAPVVTPVVAARPAAFLREDVAAAINQDGSIHSRMNPALRGSIVSIYVTGLGAGSLRVEDGQVAALTRPGPAQIPTVTLGGRPAAIEYAGPAPGLVFGVWQLNIRIPNDAPGGIVPLAIRIGDMASTTGAALAVR